MSDSKEDLEVHIRENLAGVYDPCSRHNGTNLTLLEMGMIEDVRLDDEGSATVDLFLDDPMCIYMVDIHLGVREAVLAVPGVSSVHVNVVADRLWTPDLMSRPTREKIARWEQARHDNGKVALTLLPTRRRA